MPTYGQYTVHMQAEIFPRPYSAGMTSKQTSSLRSLRVHAGLSVRSLARLIDEPHTNVSYWERSGQIPRSDKLAPIAKALGVSVEVLLGEQPRRPASPGGRAGRVFEAVSRLPRRQQDKIVDVVEALVAQHANSV